MRMFEYIVALVLCSLFNIASAQSLTDSQLGGILGGTIAVVIVITVVIVLVVKRTKSSERNYGGVSRAKFGMERNQSH
ncbi:hypothetical protein BgiBS90_025808 [Biomphalaria glabrata]|nr:hypothetical protein BgiBS90_025808 [Biomphalaria glabrata]